MPKVYDVCAKVGHYEKDGVTKIRYRNVGSVWTDKDGQMFMRINRDFNPAAGQHKDGDDTTVLSFFEPSERNGGGF